MKPDLRIKHTGRTWNLKGTTVVEKMDSTEMLFRIVTMTPDECHSLIGNLSDKELGDICKKIREHRKEGQDAGLIPKTEWPSVTSYVVNKHIAKKGWN